MRKRDGAAGAAHPRANWRRSSGRLMCVWWFGQGTAKAPQCLVRSGALAASLIAIQFAILIAIAAGRTSST